MVDWQECVNACAASTPFHHSHWLQLFQRTYGVPVRIVGLIGTDGIHASAPFVEIKRPWGKRRLLSLPFTDCIRPLARSNKALARFARQMPVFFGASYHAVVLKTDRALLRPVDSGLVRHELRIDAPFDALAKRFAKSLQRNVRRAEMNGLEFAVECSEAALGTFYQLHVATRRKLGVPVQPRSFFANVFELLIRSGLAEVAVARWQGQVVSAAVLLRFNHTLVYKYGASDPGRLQLRPNDFLFFHMIRHAASTGVRRFDFGTSELGQAGLRRFKSKWGAAESGVILDYLVGQPAGRSRLAGPLMRVSKKVIQHTPKFVCRLLGETLYKYGA